MYDAGVNRIFKLCSGSMGEESSLSLERYWVFFFKAKSTIFESSERR